MSSHYDYILKIWSESIKNWRRYDWTMKLKKKEKKIIITRLDQSNVLDWKVSSILLKTKFIISNIMFRYRCRSSIWFCLSRFQLNLIVNNGYISISKYWWRNTFTTGCPFFNDHTWKFGVFLSKIYGVMNWQIKRICIYLALDSKGQRDLQCHMIFYMTSKSYGLPRFLCPNCD